MEMYLSPSVVNFPLTLRVIVLQSLQTYDVKHPPPLRRITSFESPPNFFANRHRTCLGIEMARFLAKVGSYVGLIDLRMETELTGAYAAAGEGGNKKITNFRKTGGC